MEAVLFYSVIVLALYYVGRGFLSSGPGYFALPSLFAIVVLFWVIPQLSSIRVTFAYLEQPLITIYLMTALAMFGTDQGWRLGMMARGGHSSFIAPDLSTLFGTTIVLTIIAGVTTLLIRDQGEGIGGVQTGIITILLFFNNLKIIALFLSFYLALRHRSRAGILLVVINLLIYAPLILLYFRRRAMLELAVCLILSFWLARRILVPRTIVLAALPVGFVMMFAVSSLRTLALADGEWSYLSLADLSRIDFLAMNPFVNAGFASEMLNAVHLSQLADLYGSHTWGTNTWNRLVFQWVPAQFVGFENKMSLMFEDTIAGELSMRFGYSMHRGTTRTGIADAYLEFGYFGALFFTATGYVMGLWWADGNRGNPWAMALFVGGLTPALFSVTHYAFYFFNAVLLFLIMIWTIRTGLKFFDRPKPWRSHSARAHATVARVQASASDPGQ